MENKNVLFENMVYSQGIDPYELYFGDAPHIISKNQCSKDEDLYPKLLSDNGLPKKFPFTPGEQLYLYNDEETDIRNSYLKMIQNNQYDLHLSRKVIVDDHYPVNVEYFRPFKKMTARRKTDIMLGEYQLTFGRECLVEMIGMCRYYQAWPELREILLHDDDRRMKLTTRSILRNFPINIVVPILHDAFEHLTDYYYSSILVDMVGFSLPSPNLVQCLTDVFERYYYEYPTGKMEMYKSYTIQNNILKACEKIPSIRSLRLIEEGVNHPYEHIERQAISSLYNWGRNTAQYISLNLTNFKSELLKSIEMIQKKYDFDSYKSSLELFKKI